MLEELAKEAEHDLLLATIEVGRGGNSTPVSHLNKSDQPTWLLVQIFRDTIARQLRARHHSRASSLERGTFFRRIYRGGDAYTEYKEFRESCMSIIRGEWLDLGDDLKTLKEYASNVVEDLAKNELMIDSDSNGVGYLTCVKVGREDLPWNGTSK
ncbi:hypothetical protein M011DRAFT_474586 [Sporormia fimetaria CBS 119925]|uniref:Uncharacterized protein n=1 Tax=Sporormia fimetaria CBS 119925 TaxID=1340428 RepID=A0A6A6VJX8_9PLEO|nr:hypothetical protein M011DRAFT_474586 [Sporormia fimetaria CBS 119925]